ncbi:MAG: PRC-barrel domain-containing protein [Rhodoferax sp.]|nr:PRC-barrel domain-containing protein [Rhodoferax sp.]
MRSIKGYSVTASDGEVGKVQDGLFDDQHWVIRYVVVDAGSWLTSREVLISPYSMDSPDAEEETLPVNISKEQVKNSPHMDTHPSVSRQHEIEFSRYYGYPYYWGGEGLWGDSMYLSSISDRADQFQHYDSDRAALAADKNDPHLRSVAEVLGYHIHALDGELGHVSDVLVEADSWAIRYLVVRTSNWWLGHEVLIPPQWIVGVSWEDRIVDLNVLREKIQGAPRYESTTELNRQQELAFFRHHERPAYWSK